jgi:hypothetical protein
MRADLGHQKHFVAAAFQAFPHPIFSFAAMIFPAVVKKSDAAIDGLLDDANGGLLVRGVALMMAAESQCRNLLVVAPERLHRNAVPDGSSGGHRAIAGHVSIFAFQGALRNCSTNFGRRYRYSSEVQMPGPSWKLQNEFYEKSKYPR